MTDSRVQLLLQRTLPTPPGASMAAHPQHTLVETLTVQPVEASAVTGDCKS